jgi:tetraacyldisaccharide 4'-kinase
MFSAEFWENLWYRQTKLKWAFIPVSWLFILICKIRQLAYFAGLLPVQRLTVPVIVIGNITVGGTGKTPLIIWMVEYLRNQGYKPGVVSRGYKGTESGVPQQVRPDSNPYFVGDEPVMISRKTNAPVAVSHKRYLAAKELMAHSDCNIILCDDGLQHYGLHRDIEIAVVDGDRQFGNGFCLPAGPLREPISRLKEVDMVVCNGKEGKNQHMMEYEAAKLILLADENVKKSHEQLAGKDIHAVAGIGNPERFFTLLRSLGYRVIKHPFPDHHTYVESDFNFNDDLPVIMTEKDAIKCKEFAKENYWYLPIAAKLGNTFEHRLHTLIQELPNG